MKGYDMGALLKQSPMNSPSLIRSSWFFDKDNHWYGVYTAVIIKAVPSDISIPWWIAAFLTAGLEAGRWCDERYWVNEGFDKYTTS